MNIETWKQISKDYELAKKYLYCPKGVDTWHREEAKGTYFLLKAYLTAKEEEKKDCLLYARILMTMYWENRFDKTYYLFAEFIEPAFNFYNKALETDDKPSEKELKFAKKLYDETIYEREQYNKGDEGIIALIEGLNEIPEFCFHDSEVLSISVEEDNITLILDYEGSILVEFKFHEYSIFDCNVSIHNQYVCDYYCLRDFSRPTILLFSLDCGIIIECHKISAKRIYKKN